ncbi:MAG: aspartate/glutamate racemase family protein [Nitrososphaerota archaeon]|nr:aspartate/glutamate racemase family protein [Candidatus Calditenuaceae archaeon]MDW8072897.1 aspartate/glutamate racemase family protein [Nitrososphaerota archaeon]
MAKILYINPVGTDLFDTPTKKYLETYVDRETSIDVVSFESGPHHLEYYSYDALMVPRILREVKRSEKDGYDACVIGCFYDPGLREAREISNIVVTAPLESSASIALSLGDKFSIIVGRKKWIPLMMSRVKEYGLRDRLTSFKDIEMGVHDLHKDERETERRLFKVVGESIEEGAEVVILGCTVFFGFYRQIQEKYNIPVIDPIVAAVKQAEQLVKLKEFCGWSHSRIYSYSPPPTSELQKWNLSDLL